MNKLQNNMEFSEEEVQLLQKKSLELLLYFKKICDENNLLFYFCGGCCIGAIRHRGFIPWDDDIDVFMPRPDYERLQQVWTEKADTGRYTYARTGKTYYTRLLHTTIGDNTTTFIKTRQCDLDIDHGIRLDILPLDGCPNSKFKRKMQLLWALLYTMFNIGEPPVSKGKGFKVLGSVLLAVVPVRLHEKLWKLAEKRMSRFQIQDCSKITELCARYRYMVNEYPAEAFSSAVNKEFEGLELPVPVGYDAYLKMAFGDYMKLPPPEKRVAEHDVIYYNLDRPYREFKGIYYGTGFRHS